MKKLVNLLWFHCRFSECRWTTPQGVSCAVNARNPDCIAERSAKFIGDDRNCSLQISQAQNDLNGAWTVRFFFFFQIGSFETNLNIFDGVLEKTKLVGILKLNF